MCARAVIEAIRVGNRLYVVFQDRKEWFMICSKGVSVEVSKLRQKDMCSAATQPSGNPFTCECGQSIRRQGDLARHKCFCSREG